MSRLAVEGAPRIVLASASAVRRKLLANAGIPHLVEPGQVDEVEVKRSMKADGASTAAVAEALAEMKAARVARRHAGALVFGADQMLECDGIWFDKPLDRQQAVAHLMALSGRTHHLTSALVCVRDGARIWHHVSSASLTMRPLRPEFIDAYLDAMGERALETVGAYQLEGLGAHLFSRVEGDYFTILGLPLLAMLAFLRQHGMVAE